MKQIVLSWATSFAHRLEKAKARLAGPENLALVVRQPAFSERPRSPRILSSINTVQSRLPISGSLRSSESFKRPGKTLVEKVLTHSLGVLLALASLTAGASPKCVLVVHSFGSAAPPFTTGSHAFETALIKEMGEPVDLDEVSLDVARYTTLDMEEALIELMRKRQTKWQPDVVVPFGSPAGIFVAQYRDRLFPLTTAIIYTGMDQRRLPSGALQHNATFVGASYDLLGAVEDILRLAPATTNIVIVIGATPLEHFWADVLRREYAVFTNRLSFTWFDDLSFDQMLERSARLPPHSFMLLILLMRDAAGVTHNSNDALRRLHEVANAPIKGLFNEQLGLGIVGGQIYSDDSEGRESARIAARILRGESATNFPPKIVGSLGHRYDWRELRRWNISEDRLPPGSTVLFREPTLWERYKWRIVGIASLVLLQACLITVLVRNLFKRRSIERALRESEERLSLAAAAGDVGIWMWDIPLDQIWATENWRRMFGFTSDDIIRYKTFLGRVHEKDRQQVELAVRRTLSDHADYVSEHRVLTPDGTARWVIAQGRVYSGADGRQQRMLGASVDITARKKAEEASRDLSGRLLRAQEEERARIAKELHDGLSQNLALLSVELQSFGQRLPETSGQINARLDKFSQQTKGLSTEVHRISHGLHPAKLTQLGLAVALRGFCREVEEAHGLTVTFTAPNVPRELPQDVALCLYRVSQEALQNVVKHSGATKATVTLHVTGNTSTLTITDNGKGFEPAAGSPKASLGLVSMRERVRSVDGELSVKSKAGEGTQIEARVPLPTLAHQ